MYSAPNTVPLPSDVTTGSFPLLQTVGKKLAAITESIPSNSAMF